MLFAALALGCGRRFPSLAGDGLTSLTRTLDQAQHDGRRLAPALVVLSTGAALSALLFSAHLEQRWRVPRTARAAFAGFLIIICALGVAGLFVRFGSPWTIASEVAYRFNAPPSSSGDDLSGRLSMCRATDASICGVSRGTMLAAIRSWAPERAVTPRNGFGIAHSPSTLRCPRVDLETLAELGPGGLALLLVGLACPLAAALARRHPLASGATAAYVAFLVSSVDWDWQLAAISRQPFHRRIAFHHVSRISLCAPESAQSCGERRLWNYDRRIRALVASILVPPRPGARRARQRILLSAERHAMSAVANGGGSSSLPWQYLGEARTALRQPVAARVIAGRGFARSLSWMAWYDLAVVSQRSKDRMAAINALRLNPLDPDTVDLARDASVKASVS